MDRPKILLFGDSHAYAVQRAVERRIAKGQPVPLIAHRLLKEKNGKVLGDTSFEDFLEAIRSLSSDDIVLSMIGGNQHAVFSTIQHPRPFDFAYPQASQISFSEGVELIPANTLKEFFSSGIQGRDGASLSALRQATAARVIHIIPPPPKRDGQFILNNHESRFAHDDISSLGVSSPELRMKFWLLQTDLLSEFCSQHDIEILMPPSAALDEDGFLAPEFYANDATHANPTYGELILRLVEERQFARGSIKGANS